MEVLNKDELNELERCEVVIKQGLQTFVEVGQALLTIRDKKLYRSSFRTFEEYCDVKWEIGRIYAFRLINAAEVISNLLPMGNILPQNERQTRPLETLEPEIQQQAWAAVVEQHGANISESKVREVVSDFAQVNNEIKQAKKEPMFAANTPEELLQKAKEIARERAELKRQKIDEKGQGGIIPDEDQALIDKLINGQTVVLNINRNFHAMKFAKDNECFVQIDRFSPWGNPYHIGADGNRDQVCDSFAVYFDRKLELKSKVFDLKGKALGCHCYPERCHGDHLKMLADGNE